MAASWADRDGYQTASGSATLNLRAGDKVDDSFCDHDDEGDNDDYGKYFDECSAIYVFWKKDFFKNHLESFPGWKRVLHLVWALYYVYIVVEVTLNMAK